MAMFFGVMELQTAQFKTFFKELATDVPGFRYPLPETLNPPGPREFWCWMWCCTVESETRKPKPFGWEKFTDSRLYNSSAIKNNTWVFHAFGCLCHVEAALIDASKHLCSSGSAPFPLARAFLAVSISVKPITIWLRKGLLVNWLLKNNPSGKLCGFTKWRLSL